MFTRMLFALMLPLLLGSCAQIKGEEFCGVWHAYAIDGSSEMKLEITPWKGKFYAYALEWDTDGEKGSGTKNEDFIYIADLIFKDSSYVNGKVVIDKNASSPASVNIHRISDEQMQAVYNFDGAQIKENWYRTPQTFDKKTAITHTQQTKETANQATQQDSLPPPANNKAIKDKKQTPAPTEQATQKQNQFYIIGYKEVLDYNDEKAIEKAIESLWTKLFEKDFSSRLNNIMDEQVYLTYSHYDQPKGKMSITIGYKVENTKRVPDGLSAISVPSNDYYVYPISDTQTEMDNEAWQQLETLMMYRSANSVDFEVYSFDTSYNITKAMMWVAAK